MVPLIFLKPVLLLLLVRSNLIYSCSNDFLAFLPIVLSYRLIGLEGSMLWIYEKKEAIQSIWYTPVIRFLLISLKICGRPLSPIFDFEENTLPYKKIGNYNTDNYWYHVFFCFLFKSVFFFYFKSVLLLW